MISRRMSSTHWNHFLRLDFSKAKCRYCQRVISMSRGSTGNLSRHMKLKHPAIARNGAVPEVNENGTEQIREEIEVEIHEDDSEVKCTDDDPPTSESFCTPIIIDAFKHTPPTVTVSQSSNLQQRLRKKQRLSLTALSKVQAQMREDDEFTIMGRNIANKLRKLPLDRVAIVEKLITDVIFEAQCGHVTPSSRVSFYDMRNTSFRNSQQDPSPPSRSGPKPEVQTFSAAPSPTIKAENPLPPNVVFLVPQADGQKAIPLHVQMAPARKNENQSSKVNEQLPQQLGLIPKQDEPIVIS